MQRRTLLGSTAAAAAAAVLPRAVAALTTPVSPVLFCSAHEDDETLGWGVTLTEHLAAGLDVHVLWLTGGEASNVLPDLNGLVVNSWWGVAHNPAVEGYPLLTAAEMSAARIVEARNAVHAMATGLTGTLTLHYAGLPDGAVTQAAAQAAILAVADDIAPGAPVRIKGHSDVVDDHPDHLACGRAMRALSTADPVRFSDRRHYILPAYWSDPRLSLVTHSWDLPTDATISHRAINAARAYGAWAPSEGSFAIGMHSVSAMFATILATPKSMYHA